MKGAIEVGGFLVIALYCAMLVYGAFMAIGMLGAMVHPAFWVLFLIWPPLIAAMPVILMGYVRWVEQR